MVSVSWSWARGAGLFLLGGSSASGICRTESRARVASPLGLESGWWPSQALWGLPKAGPGQGPSGARTLGQRVRGTGRAARSSGGHRVKCSCLFSAGTCRSLAASLSCLLCKRVSSREWSSLVALFVPAHLCASPSLSLLMPPASSFSAPAEGAAGCLILLSLPL